ncbi:hotdog fold thioesterase [Sneathiella sp. P13V-1]|uniref:PaaI family thioesterase n=1 Tax=Sneathiella sp. P13V-1 TaxID=2697366 RepID=UPI00187B4EF6|nr:PaaI family thioesterase [Sneathiella sp. P13V-1]MBE7638265.1 hotdog fold thioesterase [Sneathiella sp. P13V-1]
MSLPFDVKQIQHIIDTGIPHCSDIGIKLEEIDGSAVVMRLPYDTRFVGNPVSGVLHGGIITTLIDTASGMCVYAKKQAYLPIATLDLRIDYLKAAEPERDVLTRAECYRLTRQIAFVKAVAYHDDVEDPIANSVSTFMLQSTPTPPLSEMTKKVG